MARTRSYGARMGLSAGTSAYRYTLAPWVWDTTETPHWRLPTSTMGGVDLRALAAQEVAGGQPQGFAFCASLQSVDGTSIVAAQHMNEAAVTTAMRDAWQSAMGFRPDGANLVDLLWDQLTTGSDPDGIDGPKPLMPGTDGMLDLHVGGHSLVKRQRFRFGVHPHTGKVRDLLQRQFSEQWEATNGHEHCRRVLDFTCQKFRVDDWREFVPQRLRSHVPGRLPHATTYTDDFNRANQSLDDTAAWAEVNGNWFISGNSVFRSEDESTNTGYTAAARFESNLSGDDHYAQVVFNLAASTFAYMGAACRFNAASAELYYSIIREQGSIRVIGKVVAGTPTSIQSDTSGGAPTRTVKLEANGSSLTLYDNGVSAVATTDTSITGNLRTGIVAHQSASLMSGGDDFETADLEGGGGGGNRRRRMLICGRA